MGLVLYECQWVSSSSRYRGWKGFQVGTRGSKGGAGSRRVRLGFFHSWVEELCFVLVRVVLVAFVQSIGDSIAVAARRFPTCGDGR